jgi:hypothetical protein
MYTFRSLLKLVTDRSHGRKISLSPRFGSNLPCIRDLEPQWMQRDGPGVTRDERRDGGMSAMGRASSCASWASDPGPQGCRYIPQATATTNSRTHTGSLCIVLRLLVMVAWVKCLNEKNDGRSSDPGSSARVLPGGISQEKKTQSNSTHILVVRITYIS